MANQLFANFLFTDAGVAINGATVDLLARNTTTPVLATTTTNASGYWAISYATEGRYDVRITNGSSIRWHMYDASAQFTALEVQTLRVRNPAFTFDYDIVPGAITADRQLNLPVITGTDTLAVLGLAQTFSGATITFSGGTASTSTSTGTIVISGSGGLGVGGSIWTTDQLNFASTASGWTVGATRIYRTAGSGLILGGTGTTNDVTVVNTAGNSAIEIPTGTRRVVMPDSTASTSTTTGALVVTGGVGVGGNVNVANLVKIAGTAVRATTEGTNHLDIFDGTAPVGTLANGISLYSTAGELRVMDSAGNATLLSPHARDGSWIYDSHSPVTGKHLRVDMERMVKFLNEKFGQDWVKEVQESLECQRISGWRRSRRRPSMTTGA